MTVLDGQIYSGWVEAMWPTTKTKGLAPKGVVLNTLEGVSQVILSEVITSLYTGEIETDGSKLESQLMTADYLQVRSCPQSVLCVLHKLKAEQARYRGLIGCEPDHSCYSQHTCCLS